MKKTAYRYRPVDGPDLFVSSSSATEALHMLQKRGHYTSVIFLDVLDKNGQWQPLCDHGRKSVKTGV